MRTIAATIFTLSICFMGISQVMINEFSAANYNDHADTTGEYEDWVELYNNSAADVDISGYFLSDKITNPTKWEIPSGTVIGANDFLIFYCSKKSDFFPLNNHTNFKITQTKTSEAIVFADPSGTLLDSHDIDANNQRNHSFGRRADGGADWGIYTNPTPNASNTMSTSYGDYAPKPDIDTIPGFYTGPLSISISEDNQNLNMYYTLDGSTPTINSTPISNGGTITLTQTTNVKIKAFHNDNDTLPSFIKNSTFFIDENISIPVLSISGDEIETLLDGVQIEPEGFLEYFEADGEYDDEAYGDFNEHGNDSWAYDQRGFDFICRDQYGYDYAVKEKFFKPHSQRDKFQRLIIKAAASDNYSFENGAHIRDAYVQMMSVEGNLELDERKHLSCIVFVNGKYWGVYEIREKVDDNDFTDYYFDQDTYDLDFLKTWGGTWEEYGSRQDWDNLVDFVNNNDMSIDNNYDNVDDQFNILSFIDYYLLNTHTVCMDWLNWNTAWWKGNNPNGQAKKWRYALWDMDATFGHYVNFTGVPNTGSNADPCSMEELPSDFEGHTHILTKLQDNPRFFDLYINRYADLNNTLFNCDTMIAILDKYVSIIDPEMDRQANKWGGSYTGWQQQVTDLENFILDRCAFIDGGIEDCYDVEGPFPVTILIDPPFSDNRVQLNTITPSVYPFVGDYFTGVNLSLQALAASGYQFVEWQVNNNTLLGNASDTIVGLDFVTGPDTIVAVFEPTILEANTRLTFVCEPPGSCNLSLSGNPIATLPHLQYFFDATPISVSVAPSANNFVFNDWTINSHSLSPNTTSTSVNFVLNQNDVLVANFTDLNAPTNINELEYFDALKVYPNPVSEILFVEYPNNLDLEYTIMNINGSIVAHNNLQNNQISISDLRLCPGNYIIRFADENAVNYQQILVK